MTFLRRTNRQRFWRVLAIVFAATLGLSILAATAQYLVSRSLPENPTPLHIEGVALLARQALDLILTILLFGAHIAVCGQTMLLASNSLARERQAGTWDLLLLTDQTPRRIAASKWQAILRYVVDTQAELILLRIAATLWLGIIVFATSDTYVPITDFPRYDAWRYLTAPLIVLAFTLLDLIAAATIGIVLSALGRREVALLAVGLLAGGTVLILRALGAGFLRPWVEFWPAYQNIVGAVKMTPLALFTPALDGGVHLALEQLLQHPDSNFASLGVVGALYLIPFGALTWALLRLSGWLAARKEGLRDED